MTVRKPRATQQGDFTKPEAAAVLNIGPTKLDALIKDGPLEAYKLGKGPRAHVRITRESVEAVRRGQLVGTDDNAD